MARTEAPPPPAAPPVQELRGAVLAAPDTTVQPAADREPTAAGAAAGDGRPVRQSAGRGGRGMPVAPALTAAGNAAVLAATGSYEAGGWTGVAALGVGAAGSAAVAVVRRRSATKRRMAAGSGGRRSNGSGRGSSGVSSGAGTSARGPRGASGLRMSPRGGTSAGGAAGRGRKGAVVSSGSGSPRGVTAGWQKPSRLNSRSTGPGNTGNGAGRGGRPGSALGAGSSATTHRGPRSLGRGAGGGARKPGLVAAMGRAARATGSGITRAVQPGSAPRRSAAALGRNARKVWAASKPGRTTARKALARALKATAGAVWDGSRALAAGLWEWTRGDRKTAWARLRDVWARLRKRRADKAATRAAHDKTTAGSQDPDDEAQVGASARRPKTTPIPATFTGGTTMSGGHHFVAPAMEAARAAAAYAPTGMMQVGADFDGLQQALELNAEAMRVTVENADAHFPLDPGIIEIMRQVHSLQMKAAEMAQELGPAFRKLHQVDIDRIENPRKGHFAERMWDVGSNT